MNIIVRSPVPAHAEQATVQRQDVLMTVQNLREMPSLIVTIVNGQ